MFQESRYGALLEVLCVYSLGFGGSVALRCISEVPIVSASSKFCHPGHKRSICIWQLLERRGKKTLQGETFRMNLFTLTNPFTLTNRNESTKLGINRNEQDEPRLQGWRMH